MEAGNIRTKWKQDIDTGEEHISEPPNCPHCNVPLDTVELRGNYTERVYGTMWRVDTWDGDGYSEGDTEWESDDSEMDSEEFTEILCPHCGRDITSTVEDYVVW